MKIDGLAEQKAELEAELKKLQDAANSNNNPVVADENGEQIEKEGKEDDKGGGVDVVEAGKEAAEVEEAGDKESGAEGNSETGEDGKDREGKDAHETSEKQTIAELQAQIATLKQNWQKLNGRYGSETDTLRKEKESQKQMIDSLNATIQKLSAKEATEKSDKDEDGLIPADVEAEYPELALILKKVLPSIKDTSMAAKVEDLQKQIAQLSEGSQASATAQKMEALSPGFVADNGGVDGNGKPNQQWMDFLDEPICEDLVDDAKMYYGKDVDGLSYRDAAKAVGVPALIAQIHKKFKMENGGKGKGEKETPEAVSKQKSLRPKMEQMAVTVKQGAASAAPSKAKPALKMADWEAVQEEKAMSWKKSPKERAEIDARYEMYEKAAVDGRLT